jgi:hypothetical protein
MLREQLAGDSESLEELHKRLDSYVGEASRGISGFYLSCVPGLAGMMQARYDQLVSLCQYDVSTVPERYKGVLLHNRTAELLPNLSALRAQLGVACPLSRFKRVLPLTSMPVLADGVMVNMCYIIVRARCKQGKPMHAWELCKLLSLLSFVGSAHEKWLYLEAELQSISGAYRQSRRMFTRPEHQLRAIAKSWLEIASSAQYPDDDDWFLALSEFAGVRRAVRYVY